MKTTKRIFLTILAIIGVWASGLVCLAAEVDDGNVPYSLMNYGTEEIHTGRNRIR